VNVLSVVVRLRELLEDGRRCDGSLPGYVVTELEMVLEGLEHDLAPRPRLRCEECGLRFQWPGQLDDHCWNVHWRERAA
jgi:hypothetical protein